MKFEHAQNTLKYKVGDKVELMRVWYPSVLKGSILTVVKDGELDPYWINKDSVEVSMLNVYSEEFKLVEDSPKAQDNSWYENGEIPPVNTKCIFTGVDVAVEGVILAHVEYRGQYSAIIQCDGDWWPGEVGEFRPWYSDEEIAAQEREKVVNKMCDICNPSGIYPETSKLMCRRLYDAGLRFVEDE